MLAWFPVDDEMSFHPKIMAAGNAAVGAWTRAGAWSKKYTTGGFIPEGIAHSFGTEECRRLVEVGLWTPDTDAEYGAGYRFHEWTDRAGNGTAAEERARKDRERERWRKQKQAQRARGNGGGQDQCPPVDTGADPPPDPAYPQSQSQSKDLLLTDLVGLGSNAREKSTDEESIEQIEASKRTAETQRLNLDRIRALASERCERDLGYGEALRLGVSIMSKAKRSVGNPSAYVAKAFDEWQEVQKLIDTEVRL
jgi:hypothetical protein